MEYINRVLRPIAPGVYDVIVNDEFIATVRAESSVLARALATIETQRAEARLNDFFFVIDAIDEPEMGATHRVTMAARGSGRVMECFVTDDPYGAVEAAREAQAYSLEERMDMYAGRGW